MKARNVYLELTRNCTLECEHCLRGNKEVKNMNINTLEKILKDFTKINCLLLSGGEPLLNRECLEYLPIIIQKYQIEVGTIGIITNGTICTTEHIKALQQLQRYCEDFEFVISCDLFHRLEWKRLHIEDRVEENYKRYQEYLPVRKYQENDLYHRVTIWKKGRAQEISEERFKELYKRYYVEYQIREEEENSIIIDGDTIKGKIYFDVNGNMRDYSASFQEEDELSQERYNIHIHTLKEILENYKQDFQTGSPIQKVIPS